jgi:CubicO group peptidase (beta-lactamase class C family)
MMKFKISWLLIWPGILVGIMATGQRATFATNPVEQETPLRLAEPAESIVADLERFIPDYMREEEIPGVTIALIREGEVVWTGGFGVANTLTRRPVSPDTLFEVASNSKVLTAYLALRLVDQGQLGLDEPLNAYLPEPWLPPSEYRDAITLRHVLSHSSGLSHNTASRESLFAPVGVILIRLWVLSTCKRSSSRSPANRWRRWPKSWCSGRSTCPRAALSTGRR